MTAPFFALINDIFGNLPLAEQPLTQVAAEKEDGEPTERIGHRGEISDDVPSES